MLRTIDYCYKEMHFKNCTNFTSHILKSLSYICDPTKHEFHSSTEQTTAFSPFSSNTIIVLLLLA